MCGAPAFAQDAILTSDVPVDVTATDATAARELAMRNVEREGLSALLDKLGAKEKALILEQLEEKTLSAMVKGVEVMDEKITGNRYRATLRVSYNALAVNTLLGTPEPEAENVTPQEERITSSSILIIPVYDEDGTTVLWERTNPWRDGWRTAVTQMPGGNLVVPYYDASDAGTISTEATKTVDFNALLPFFKRYGVGEIVIMRGTYTSGTRTTKPFLQVSRRHISQNRTDQFMMDYRPDEGEDKIQLLTRAAKDLAQQVSRQREELIASQMEAGVQSDGRLLAIVPMRTMTDWTEVRKRITNMQSITKVEVSAMSAAQVDVVIRHKGPGESLANELRALGLRVTPASNYWVISRY